MIEAEDVMRAFKTAWFTKAAQKALIRDDEPCTAIAAAIAGQANDLGGGVFKKRLDKNRSHSIILAKGLKYWVYVYLFAKKDKENIDDSELQAFRKLADLYAKKTALEIDKDLKAETTVEICHDDEAKI